jgi:hypothetical protein
VAGSNSQVYSGDNGPALSAGLLYPTSVYLDTLIRMFIAERYRIRMVDTNSIITTFAGTGNDYPFNGDNIPATLANLDFQIDVKGDTLGNIYIARQYGHRIQMVNSVGIITTVMGTGNAGASLRAVPLLSNLNYPRAIWLDSQNNCYLSEGGNLIRKTAISATFAPTSSPVTSSSTLTVSQEIIAGNYFSGFSGDNGPATLATINPFGFWVASNGNIFVAEGSNSRIRKIDSSGIIITIAGNGMRDTAGSTNPATSTSFYQPTALMGDSAGTSDQRNIWKYVFSTGIVSVFAGTSSLGYSDDSITAATSVSLNQPTGIWLTTSNVLYVADTGNSRIQMIFSTNGIISTVAGSSIRKNVYSW